MTGDATVNADSRGEPNPIPPNPRKLRLSGHVGKRTPAGHLGLDKVLDELGRRQFPKEWGCLPGWQQMPFRYLKKTKSYRGTFRLSHAGGKWILRHAPLKSKLRIEDCKACSKLYREVCGSLMDAFEQNELQAYAMLRPSGEIVALKNLGIWSAQGARIFYTGLLVPDDAATLPARVIVKEDAFWVWMRGRATLDQREARQVLLEKLGVATREHFHASDYRIICKDLRVLVDAVLAELHEEKLTVAEFKNEVWGRVPPTLGGAPKKIHTEHREEYQAALTARLRQAIGLREPPTASAIV